MYVIAIQDDITEKNIIIWNENEESLQIRIKEKIKNIKTVRF